MRFSTIASAFLAPLCAQAVVMFTNNAYNGITAGTPFTLTWSGDGTPVTIYLLRGPPEMLVKVNTVANEVIGSSYVWTPPTTLHTGTYALSITQSASTNYSPQFSLTNTGGRTSTFTYARTPITFQRPPTTTVIEPTNLSSLPPTSTSPAPTTKPQQSPPLAPALAVVSDFIPTLHASFSIDTIRVLTPTYWTSSTGPYVAAATNGTVASAPSSPPAAAATAFTKSRGGTTRLGGMEFGSVMAMFVGTVLLRYAF